VGTVEDELPMEVEGGHQVKVLPASRVVSLQANAGGRRRAVTHNSFVHCHRNSLQPARDRGNELEKVIAPMFAVMNVYTGDQVKLTLQVAEWCHYLEEFPLYAIRKAAKWTVVGRDKLPSVAAFIADVKLAIGPGVLE
jgi:hypothetical protein